MGDHQAGGQEGSKEMMVMHIDLAEQRKNAETESERQRGLYSAQSTTKDLGGRGDRQQERVSGRKYERGQKDL
jgi:hypothetical protein